MKNTQDAACLGAAIVAGFGYGAWDSIAETALRFAEVDHMSTIRNPNTDRPTTCS